MNCNDENTLVSAGDLARELGRSGYGIKKALARLGVSPTHVLSGGTYYYDRKTALAKLESAMRAPNSTPRS